MVVPAMASFNLRIFARNAVFFEVRASWIILGYFCIRMPELCQEEIVSALPALKLLALAMEKTTMTMRMTQSGHLLFTFFASDIS